MRKHVIFRCDAGRGIGNGHAMRCLALADKLHAMGWLVQFAMQQGADDVPALRERPFGIIELSGGNIRFNEQPNIIVIDHYKIDAAIERKYRRSADAIVVIDDLPVARVHDCDLLLDFSPGSTPDAWKKYASHASLLIGPQFALIREDLLQMRARARKCRSILRPMQKILISFGMSDSRNATSSAITACRNFDPEIQIDVVVSTAFPRYSEVVALASEHEVTVHDRPVHFPQLLLEADVVIGSAGLSALEQMSLGIPAIFVTTHVGQSHAAASLHSQGAAINTGDLDSDSGDRISAALTSLHSPETRRTMSNTAFDIVDGDGASRVASHLETHILPLRRHS